MTVNGEAGIAAACSQVVFRFLRHLDAREYDQLPTLMAPAGVWERAGQQLSGAEQILAAMNQRPANLKTCHVASNLSVECHSPTSATATFLLLAYAKVGDEPNHLHGIFEERSKLVLVADGWRFLHKQARPVI